MGRCQFSFLGALIRVSSSLLLAGFIMVSPLFAGKWQPMRPEAGGKRSVLIIKGNEWAYWRLKPGEKMHYEINKEGEYRIITRVHIGDKDKKEIIYTFRMGPNSTGKRLYSRATEKSRVTRLKGKPKTLIGESRTIYLKLEPTDEILEFAVDKDADYTVYFRVLEERDVYTDNVEYIPFTPTSYVDAIGILTREIVSTYYRVDRNERLTVIVNGPTTLKVLGRVITDGSMKGRVKFAVAVFEDGTLKNTYSLQTIASTVSEVMDMPAYICSKGESFYIEVPKGRHRYNFNIPETDQEVILRFFLPEEDIGIVPD